MAMLREGTAHLDQEDEEDEELQQEDEFEEVEVEDEPDESNPFGLTAEDRARFAGDIRAEAKAFALGQIAEAKANAEAKAKSKAKAQGKPKAANAKAKARAAAKIALPAGGRLQQRRRAAAKAASGPSAAFLAYRSSMGWKIKLREARARMAANNMTAPRRRPLSGPRGSADPAGCQ